MRAVTKLTQINLSYRGLHSDVPPVCCEVSRALTRRGLATLARLRTEATIQIYVPVTLEPGSSASFITASATEQQL